ncbi:hypothetical protein BYT27DRAFT_7196296 [Phlegmacium glaucopus]|nr:hypothetical protein BYT27DRAFT_7196296 [Phlegmacium glaucopus]
MHLLSSLIVFLAFTFFTSINASPIPLEFLNSRDISVVIVRTDNTNLPELLERNAAVHDSLEWQGALESKPDTDAHAASKRNLIDVSVIGPEGKFPIGSQAPRGGPGSGTGDWRRHSDGPPSSATW